MRLSKMFLAVVVGGMTVPAVAQLTANWPVGEMRAYFSDSGVRPNAAFAPVTVFVDLVAVKDASWLRIYFEEVELEGESFVRMTSLLDGEVQELDARGMSLWSNSSAYFNGEAVLVELVAAGQTTRSRILIGQVAVEGAVPHPAGTCGICEADDRVPSNEDWAARMLPAGCTASVFNMDSCMVSAGHCVAGGDIMQFRVPSSNPNNCNINHPPVADQFPVTQVDFDNNGVGNDWSVMTTGNNNLGETAYDRYGEFLPITTTPPSPNNPVAVWGYGIDENDCDRNQTQQTDNGQIVQVDSTFFRHNVDITFGNSGSSVIRNGEIVGIITHCPCPGSATRVDHPAFAAAREDMCPSVILVEAPLQQVIVTRGIPSGGDLSSLQESDNDWLVIGSVLNDVSQLSDPDILHITHTIVQATSPFSTVQRLDLTTEVGVNQTLKTLETKILLRNWSTFGSDVIDTYAQSAADTQIVYMEIPNPNDYIRASDGRIEVRIVTTIKRQNAPNGYVARIDHVQVDVLE